jgi:hypothetical protein
MCEIGNGLKERFELEVNLTTAQAIQFGVHTGVLQAKSSYDLHLQLCPNCKPVNVRRRQKAARLRAIPRKL